MGLDQSSVHIPPWQVFLHEQGWCPPARRLCIAIPATRAPSRSHSRIRGPSCLVEAVPTAKELNRPSPIPSLSLSLSLSLARVLLTLVDVCKCNSRLVCGLAAFRGGAGCIRRLWCVLWGRPHLDYFAVSDTLKYGRRLPWTTHAPTRPALTPVLTARSSSPGAVHQGEDRVGPRSRGQQDAQEPPARPEGTVYVLYS